METIKIGDKLRPVSFGFAALRIYEMESGKSFGDVTDSITDTVLIVYAGLKDGARRNGDEWKATVDDVADWLTARPEAMTEIVAIYGEAMGKLNSPQKWASS